MKHAVALCLCLAAAPLAAQDAPAAPPAEDDGFSLMEEGMKLIMRGLMSEAEPALNQMEEALAEIGPALDAMGEEIGPKLRDLIGMVDDFANYDAPVMLPNGDILIRRNSPLTPPPDTLPQPGPNGEIEL